MPADIVFDMFYNPLKMLLLKHASEQKEEIITRLQLFPEQAALQFETWTGESAPRPAMARAGSARSALAPASAQSLINND